jgi:hypothetical protein
MTIKEVQEMFTGQYFDFEVYRNFNSNRLGFHTDRINSVDDYSESDEVTEYELMNREDYSQSVLANSSVSWEEYGLDDRDKILVVKIK